jgi:hypothetical protein
MVKTLLLLFLGGAVTNEIAEQNAASGEIWMQATPGSTELGGYVTNTAFEDTFRSVVSGPYLMDPEEVARSKSVGSRNGAKVLTASITPDIVPSPARTPSTSIFNTLPRNAFLSLEEMRLREGINSVEFHKTLDNLLTELIEPRLDEALAKKIPQDEDFIPFLETGPLSNFAEVMDFLGREHSKNGLRALFLEKYRLYFDLKPQSKSYTYAFDHYSSKNPLQMAILRDFTYNSIQDFLDSKEVLIYLARNPITSGIRVYYMLNPRKCILKREMPENIKNFLLKMITKTLILAKQLAPKLIKQNSRRCPLSILDHDSQYTIVGDSVTVIHYYTQLKLKSFY